MRRRVGFVVVLAAFGLLATACRTTLPSGYVMPKAPDAAAGDPNADIPYTQPADADHVLDLYYPPGTDRDSAVRQPLIVYVHGGGFGGDKVQERAAAIQRFADADPPGGEGYVVASIEYRRINVNEPITLGFADLVKDVRQSIQYLSDHASTYGIDPDRIVVAGSSVGGYLAAMAALADDPKWAPDRWTVDVKGFVDQVGPTNVDTYVRDVADPEVTTTPDQALVALTFHRIARCVEDAAHAVDPGDPCYSTLADASPTSQAGPDDPPGYLVCGERDTTVPCRYVEKLTENHAITTTFDMATLDSGDGHGTTDYGLDLGALATFLHDVTTTATTTTTATP